MNSYIEEIRKILAQEEIDFRLVGGLLPHRGLPASARAVALI
jgi:hypothetical protein